MTIEDFRGSSQTIMVSSNLVWIGVRRAQVFRLYEVLALGNCGCRAGDDRCRLSRAGGLAPCQWTRRLDRAQDMVQYNRNNRVSGLITCVPTTL